MLNLDTVSKVHTGFAYAPVEVEKATGHDEAIAMVRRVSEGVHSVDFDLNYIDAEARANGGAVRLTHGAFCDLMHFIDAPVKYIERLAQFDMDVALRAVNAGLDNLRTAKMKAVVDAKTSTVYGITSDRYRLLNHGQVLDYLMATRTPIQDVWIAGPEMRMTMLQTRMTDLFRGDKHRFGAVVRNHISGDASLAVQAYTLRLVCTNGMTAPTQAGKPIRLPHIGDNFERRLLEAVVSATQFSTESVPKLLQDADRVLQQERMPDFLGALSKSLGKRAADGVVGQVVADADSAGRSEQPLRLIDFVNGVTAMARGVKGIGEREEMEVEAFRLLHYGPAYCVN